MNRKVPFAALAVGLLAACTAQAQAAKEPATTEAPAVTVPSTTAATEASDDSAPPTDDEILASFDEMWDKEGAKEYICNEFDHEIAVGNDKETITNMLVLGFLSGYGDHPGRALVFAHARYLIQRDCWHV